MHERLAPRPNSDNDAVIINYFPDGMSDFQAQIGEFMLDTEERMAFNQRFREYLKERKFIRAHFVNVSVAMEQSEAWFDPHDIINDPRYASRDR